MNTPSSTRIEYAGSRFVPGLEAAYVRDFLTHAESDRYFEALLELEWQQETLTIFGRERPTPRLTAWYGDDGVAYRYSGTEHTAQPWTQDLDALRSRVERAVSSRFNFVLANYYRNGNDAMGWHSDDEAVLGDAPVIASLSFGANRRLRFQRRSDRASGAIDLDHGSLLVMWGCSQRDWRHSLPRSKACAAPRINLTFRHVMPR